jgi:hypothetical protein
MTLFFKTHVVILKYQASNAYFLNLKLYVLISVACTKNSYINIKHRKKAVEKVKNEHFFAFIYKVFFRYNPPKNL